MKLFKKIRKGFTLIELVVVIAVIAILSAVSVVSYVAITNNAKKSADEQAVYQMNTVLKAEGIMKAATIDKLYALLEENGLDPKTYTPLMKGRYFFWDSENNVIVYAEAKDDDYVATYPASNKGEKASEHSWYSLNGAIEEKKVTANSDHEYVVSKAEELYYLAKNDKVEAGEKVKLTADTIDLMGADVNFSFAGTEAESLEYRLEGKDTGTTIKGLVQDKNKIVVSNESSDNNGKAYYSGLVQSVGPNAKVYLSHITLEDIVVGDLETGSVGVIAGVVGGNRKTGQDKAELVLDDVHINRAVVNGKNKVGGFVGSLWTGKLTINSNCSITNSTINCSEGEAGIFVGNAFAGAEITIGAGVNATGTHTELVQSSNKRTVIDGSSISTGTLVSLTSDNTIKAEYGSESISFTSLVEKLNITNNVATSSNTYRMFHKDAKINYSKDSSSKDSATEALSVKLNTTEYKSKGRHLVVNNYMVAVQSYTVALSVD